MSEEHNYSELQSRVAIANERNRANSERRNELLKNIKEEHGCKNIAELKALLEKKEKEYNEEVEKCNLAEEKAVASVKAVEEALGIVNEEG